MLQGVKQRARRDGLEFALTKADFLSMPTHCPVLGLELRYGGGDGRQDYSASIDRKDSSKGYVPGNVRIMSWRANSLLKDATIEELRALVMYLERSF